MSAMTRRRFIEATSAGITAAPLVLSRAWGRMSANETIGHAVIGTGKQGSGHVRRFQESRGCEVVAVCDVDGENLRKAAKDASKNVKTYTDFGSVRFFL